MSQMSTVPVDEVPAAAIGRSNADPGTGGATPKKSRAWWPWLAAAAVVIVAGVVGGLLLARPATDDGPRNSLTLVAQAAQSGDWNAVNAYLDVEAVAGHYADTAFAQATGSATASVDATMPRSSGMGGSRPQTGPAAMKKVFVARTVQSLRTLVERGDLDANAGGLQSLMLVGEAESVDAGESRATVTVVIPGVGGKDETVILTMNKVDERWRIVAVDGISSLLGTAADEQQTDG
ncbi:MAG: hypothetical protein WBI63_07510 [Coriobacteriia bacterium]